MCEQHFNNLWTTKWLNLMKSHDVKYREMCANPNFQLSFVNDYEIHYAKELSKNPNLRLEFILAHPTSNWDWDEISKHPNVTMEMIDAYPELPWDLPNITLNPNFTREYHDKIAKCDRYNQKHLFFYSKYAIRRDYIASQYETYAFYMHWNQFTEENLEILFEYADKMNFVVSSRVFRNDEMQNISIAFVEKYIDKPWNWNSMHLCHDFTMDFVFRNLHRDWNWLLIVEHCDFTHEHLKYQPFNQSQQYVAHFFACNPNATYNVMKQTYPQYMMTWKCRNKNITIQDITRYDKPNSWDYSCLSRYKNMTLHFVACNEHKPWSWKTLAKNPLDRLEWVNRKICCMIIAVLLEYHEMVYSTNRVENVFGNDYLVMNVMRFL